MALRSDDNPNAPLTVIKLFFCKRSDVPEITVVGKILMIGKHSTISALF